MKPRLLRLHTGLLLFALLVFLAPSAPAETTSVPLRVTMLHGGAAAARFETTDDGQASREVMFLVLDYSWSMTSNKDGGRKTRWQRLCESLKSTLDSVKVGTEVRIAWIGGSRKNEKPVLIRSETEKQALLKIVKDRGSPPNGNGTPLFATLKAVCGEANDLAASGCSITINVISDGESNEVPIYRARESWTKEQIQDLDNQYTSLFSDRRFNACLVWINPGEPPGKEPMLGGRTWCTGYKAPPSLYSTSVQSTPVTVELSDRAAPGALSYGFFVPDNIWGGMVGKPAQLVLSRDGKEIAEVSVQIQDSSVCAIPIPEGGIGGLSLSLKNIPQPEGALISEPRSVDLIVSEPRKISVSSTRPADGTALKEGGTVEFAVVANPPDAKCEWSFGDGSAPSSGGKVSHKYDRAGEYTAQVVVRKEGFEPVTGIERKIKVRVLHTKVALEPFEAPVVGREAVFRCKGEGPVTGYTWYVDGESFAGKDSSDMRSSEFRKTFSDSGEHAVHVRADMSFVSSEESERKTFKVGEAPFVRIDAPLSGSSMTVGDETNLSAHAEGGVAAIEWKIDGPEPKSFESPVVGAAAPANWTPGKPGEYTIRAIDKANKADPSGEVKITVRPRDVALRIAGISDGETVWTGSNFSLKAETKGVESVRWSVIDEDRGTTNGIGSVKTDLSGIALKAWTPSFKESDGARLILAEDETGAAEPASVLVNLKTKADLSIEKPSDYHPVAFGTPVELAAKADGAVENIRWFVDGKEIKGKGKTASFTPALERGVPEKLFKVHAEAFKPSDPKDRPSLRTAVRTVVARCPELQPHIDLQKKDWDVGAPVQFKVVSPIGRIGEVVWSFGDGTQDQTSPGDAHSHLFAATGDYVVSARAVCADCGASFPVAAVPITVRCPPLAPVVLEASPTVDIGAPASFAARHSGKASEYRWTFGDNASTNTAEPQVSHSYARAGTYAASVVAVCSSCGKEFASDTPATVEVACPDPIPAIVCTGPNGVEGASFGRNRRIEMVLRVRAGTEGNVQDVRWLFSDGTEERTGARTSTHHEFKEYATNAFVRVEFSCRQCGSPYASEKSLVIEGQPPKAAFRIEPERDRYSINGVVEFRDASDGDVDRCVWTTNGAYFATCGQGESVRFDAPGRPTDVLVGMTAENDALAAKGDDRAKSAVSPPRKLRFRWGWVAACLFVALGLLLLFGLWWVLTDNGIRDCRSYSWMQANKPAAVGNQLPERQYGRLGRHIEHFKRHWTFLSYFSRPRNDSFFDRPKRVSVTLLDLQPTKKGHGAGFTKDQSAPSFTKDQLLLDFEFCLKKGRPHLLHYPDGLFYRRKNFEDVLNPPDNKHRFFVFEGRLATKPWLFVVAEKPKRSRTVVFCSILFFLGALAVLSGVLWTLVSFAL